MATDEADARQLAESMVVQHVQNRIDQLTGREPWNDSDKVMAQTELRVWVGIQQELPALLTDDTVIRDLDRDQATRELCVALGEPYATPGDHRGEPDYVMTWERVLDIARGRTKVWRDLLERVEQADPYWLAEYRRSAPGETDARPNVAELRSALDELWGLLPAELIGDVSEETQRAAKTNHDRLWHQEPDGDDIGTVRWFGTAWPSPEQPAPVCRPATHIDTPVGEVCPQCSRPIVESDSGVGVPAIGTEPVRMHYLWWHTDCFMAQLGLPGIAREAPDTSWIGMETLERSDPPGIVGS